MEYPFVLLTSLAGISILTFMVIFYNYHRKNSRTSRSQPSSKDPRIPQQPAKRVRNVAQEDKKPEKVNNTEKINNTDDELRRLLNQARFDLDVALQSKKVYVEYSKKKKEQNARLKDSTHRLKLRAAWLEHWYTKCIDAYKERVDLSIALKKELDEVHDHSDKVYEAYEDLFNKYVGVQGKLATYTDEVQYLKNELRAAQTQTKKVEVKLKSTVEQLCDLDDENQEYKRVLEKMWREKLGIEKRVQDLEDLMIDPEARTPKQESFGFDFEGGNDGMKSEGETEETNGNELGYESEEETGLRETTNLAEELAAFESGDESDD